MLANGIATEEELLDLEKGIKKQVRQGKKAAWNAYLDPILQERTKTISLIREMANASSNKVFIEKLTNDLEKNDEPIRKDRNRSIYA